MSTMEKLRMSPVKHDLVKLAGGWDQTSPRLFIPPGIVTDSKNFEASTTGGYRRIPGYERYDGQAKPSAATYSLIQVVSFTTTPSVGDTVTQATSGATGVVISVDTTNLYFTVTKVTGTWDATNSITTPGPITIGTATTATTTLTSKETAQNTNLAADQYRNDIAAVPGAGAVLGVGSLIVSNTAEVYAFRNNAGGTAVDMYKDSASGWTQVTFNNEVSFTAGAIAVPADGDTLTQTGTTATILRVVTESGTWAGGDAAGRLIIGTVTSGPYASGAATITGTPTLTLSGAETAITLATGGKFEFVVANFGGQLGSLRLYMADGANRMHEFDGTILVPIATGLTTDTPKHITQFKTHLFYSQQSSAFFSAPGDPYRHGAADSAGEIATGDTVTGFQEQPGAETVGSMAITGLNTMGILYGTGLSDWNFSFFRTTIGAYDYTVQQMDKTYLLDDRGVFDLETSLNYGNFVQASLTERIKTFITGKRSKVSYSIINRNKSQYRLFFNDGFALFMTIVNGKLLGAMQQFTPDVFNVALNTEDSSGDERSFAGGNSSGYVYELDIGSSFDGAAIEAFVTLNWNPQKNSRVRKTYRHGSIEIQSDFYAVVSFGYQLGYGTDQISQPTATEYASDFAGGPAWDSFTWDDFTWDGKTLSPTEVDVRGTAENIEVTMSSETDYIMAYTLNSLILDWTPRRRLR